MALKDKQGEAPDITRQQSRALEFFTNRYALTRLFVRHLNLDHTPERILFFCGDAGNGKSLMLRFLREYCCKRLDHDVWTWMDAADDKTFQQRLVQEKSAELVAIATLDFGMPVVGENRPQEAFSALLMLRRQLAAYKLRFPLFDFACVTYLHRTGQLTDERLKNLFPSEEMDLVVEIARVLTNSPYGGVAAAVLKLFNKHLKEKYTLYKHRRGLSEEDVLTIAGLDPDQELPGKLPSLFARDLNVAMGAPGMPIRVVLFIDTYEAFWGHERDLLGTAPGFQRDEWVRSLLRSLNLDRGIIAVLASRDSPRWEEAGRERIEKEEVELRHVEFLGTADALEYLDRVKVRHGGQDTRIPDGPLRDRLVAYASADPETVHPFYLGLCAEVVLAAAMRGKEVAAEDFDDQMEESRKGEELTQRLLSYVESELKDAIVALSACRVFDKVLYLHLGETLHFQVTGARWDALAGFSFVVPAGRGGEGWYRIHDLLRRTLLRENQGEVREAHQVLETEYRQQAEEGEETARVEAIYHATRLDAQRGYEEWVVVFDECLQLSRYRFCFMLLELRSEMTLLAPSQQGRVAELAGQYWASLARHEAAKEEYIASIAAYDAALQIVPSDPAILNNKGNVLRFLGDLQVRLSQHEEARTSYQRAGASFDAALQFAPANPEIYNNKGNVLQVLGDLQAELTQYEAARASYQQAVDSYDAALQLTPDYVPALINKGLVLVKLGDLQVRLSQHQEAQTSYRDAVAWFDAAIQLAPNSISALDNKGLVLVKLGDLQVRLSQHEEAQTSYRDAAVSFDGALQRSPNHPEILNNKGVVLAKLGGIEVRQSRHEAARTSYQAAVAWFDGALQVAPSHIGALQNRGNAFQQAGMLEASLRMTDDAARFYFKAIESYEAALAIAPGAQHISEARASAQRRLRELEGEEG